MVQPCLKIAYDFIHPSNMDMYMECWRMAAASGWASLLSANDYMEAEGVLVGMLLEVAPLVAH